MITTTKELKEVLNKAKEKKLIAIDTEFVWERTYYPNLGLVQLGFETEESFLLDVLAIDDLTYLGEILSDPTIEKIFHDAQQDLYILKRATGSFPKNIFDTKVAAGFAGFTATMSLANLHNDILNIDLPKTESRTNWLRRPLSDAQIEYAGNDVKYLCEIRNMLVEKANANKFEEYMFEEMKIYDNPKLYGEKDPYSQYKKLKISNNLSVGDSALVKELSAWRELLAQKKNIPKTFVLKNKEIFTILKKKPDTFSQLKELRVLHSSTLHKHGDIIIEMIVNSKNVNNSSLIHTSKNNNSVKPKVDAMLKIIEVKCKKINLDFSLVGSRSDFTKLFEAGENPNPKEHKLLQGWRKELFNEFITE